MIANPALRSPLIAARVVCCCQPSFSLRVATSAPALLLSSLISWSFFVVGLLALALVWLFRRSV